MTESERIESVISSIKEIHKYFSKAEVTLFLMSIKENTFLEYMYNIGAYKIPNPWGFIEVTKRILNDSELTNMFPLSYSWFGEKKIDSILEKQCYTCQNCKNKIIEALRKINGTFNNDERRKILNKLIEENSDGCYQEFLKNLEKEKDGKVPIERYKEFLEELVSQTNKIMTLKPER